PSSCVTPAGTSNELDVQNEWEEKHTHLDLLICSSDILGVVGLLGCVEPVSHLILQPKLLNCVRAHVDSYCFEEPSCAQ
ncbi:unnamed protein product, partial [Ascophyllum nodosum]